MPRDFDCDVVVIGGGPAGSTAASVLARAGRQVVLLERDRFPRFHIGESLLASVNDVFDAIGVADRIRAAGFPKKWGASFITPDGGVERFADFAISNEVRAPQTWQVPRERLDTLLLEHAAASGADVRQGHRVLDVAFDDDGATVSVRAPAIDGAPAARPRHFCDPGPRRGRRLGTGGPALARLLAARRRADAGQRRDLLALRRRAARRGPPRRRHPRHRPPRSRLVLADPDQRGPHERRRGPAAVGVPDAAEARTGRAAGAPGRRHAGGGAPDAARRAEVAGARREGLLVRLARLRRRSLDHRRGRRLVPRPRVLERRRDRARIRARRRPRRRSRAGRRPGGRPGLRRLRSAAAPALRGVPALRARLLHAGVPRPVLQRGSPEVHVPGRDHRARRLLAPLARHARVAGAVLPHRAAAAALRVRRRHTSPNSSPASRSAIQGAIEYLPVSIDR